MTRRDGVCHSPVSFISGSSRSSPARGESPPMSARAAQAASDSRGAGPPGPDGRHGLGRTAGIRRRARCREAVRTTTGTSTASSVIATPTIVSISRAQGGGTGMGRLS